MEIEINQVCSGKTIESGDRNKSGRLYEADINKQARNLLIIELKS